MKDVKIAIHNIKGSFSERWIEYCEQNNIVYKLVDCNDSDIIEQLNDCDGLMWHWGHSDYKAKLYALQLTFSIEKMGLKVFPDSKSCWHFDDKVGQKYLFEALGIPLVDSYVFYTKKDALNWTKKTSFPKVFKLRSGASSVNVSLVKNRKQANRKIKTAFTKGFPAYRRRTDMKEKFRKFLLKKNLVNLSKFFKSLLRMFVPNAEGLLLPREKGYVYFQEFIPKNTYDTRAVVIGDRIWAVRRFVRKNDFRASGSGAVDDTHELINKDILKKAFEIYDLVDAQSLAFDFLIDKDEVKIIEMSYGFPVIPSDGIQGYWDRDFNWYEGVFKSQYWMVENFVNFLIKEKTLKT